MVIFKCTIRAALCCSRTAAGAAATVQRNQTSPCARAPESGHAADRYFADARRRGRRPHRRSIDRHSDAGRPARDDCRLVARPEGDGIHGCRIGLFGASTGGGAALMSGGGRSARPRLRPLYRAGDVDLAGPSLATAAAHAALIVGGLDVLGIRNHARRSSRCAVRSPWRSSPGATHCSRTWDAQNVVSEPSPATGRARHLRLP